MTSTVVSNNAIFNVVVNGQVHPEMIVPATLAYTIGLPITTFIMGNSGDNATQFAAGTTVYMTPGLADANEPTIELLFPQAGTVQNLLARSQGSPGVAQTYAVTFRSQNLDTLLTCTIVAGTNIATDSAHSIAVAAQSRWSLKLITSASAAATNIIFSLEYDVP